MTLSMCQFHISHLKLRKLGKFGVIYFALIFKPYFILFSFSETQRESANSDSDSDNSESRDSICVVYGCKCNRKTGIHATCSPRTCSRYLVLQMRKINDGKVSVNTKRSRLWILAIRKHGYGKNWMPTKTTRICGCHFLGGKPSTQETDVNFVPTIFPEKPKSESYRKHGTSCIVAGCRHRSGRENCTRHKILQTKHRKRESLWIQAIRENREDNDWMPATYTSICGCHFVGGKPSRAKDDLNYVPTIFPDTNKRVKKKGNPIGDKPSTEKVPKILATEIVPKILATYSLAPPSNEKMEKEVPQNGDKPSPENNDFVYVPIPHFTPQAEEAR